LWGEEDQKDEDVGEGDVGENHDVGEMSSGLRSLYHGLTMSDEEIVSQFVRYHSQIIMMINDIMKVVVSDSNP